AIGEAERDAWLRHMTAALDSLVVERDVHPAIEARMIDYFVMAADAMVNTRRAPGGAPPGGPPAVGRGREGRRDGDPRRQGARVLPAAPCPHRRHAGRLPRPRSAP